MAYVFKIDSKISETLDNLTEWSEALTRSPRMYPVGPGEAPSNIHNLFAEYLNNADPDVNTVADFAKWLKDRIRRREPAKPAKPDLLAGADADPAMKARIEKIRKAQAEAVERAKAEAEEAAKQKALKAFAGSEGVQSSDEAAQQGGGKAMTRQDASDERFAAQASKRAAHERQGTKVPTDTTGHELQGATPESAGELDPDDWGN